MPGRIREDDVRTVRERAPLADVVAEYTRLDRAGGGRLKGLCPLHAEKTPSFTVDPAKGYFHCFGCGEGGDAIAFLRKVEGLSFVESVERLARVAGIDLRYEELSPGQRRALGKRTRLAEVLREAASHYQERLLDADGAAARSYLGTRGVDVAAIERYGIGWAPDAWDTLVRHLGARRFAPDEIVESGLATQGRHGLVDVFRGRVLFPIHDAGGREVIAFGGRVIPGVELQTGGERPPKYINSRESAVYAKSRTLYGLGHARREILRRGEALVVEGYMDVIGLHLAGAGHAVATCGTALTPEHLKLLDQLSPRVVLALDADDAGFAAAEKARAAAVEAGLRELSVLVLPEGHDPADLASEGPAAVAAALAGVRTAVEFQLEQVLRGARTDTPEAQAAAYRRTFPLLGQLEDRVLRYRYVRDLVAPVVGVSADRIEAELDRAVGAGRGALAQAHRSRGPGQPSRRAPAPTGRDAAADGDRAAQMHMERLVLQVALQRPDLLPPTWSDITEDDFTTDPSRVLLRALKTTRGGDLDAVLEAMPDDAFRGRVRALALSEIETPEEAGAVADLVERLRARAAGRSHEALREQLARGNEQLAPEARRELQRRLAELERSRRLVGDQRAAARAEGRR